MHVIILVSSMLLGVMSLKIYCRIFVLLMRRKGKRIKLPFFEGRGHFGLLLHQSTKFYYNVFLFVDLTTLWTWNWNWRFWLIGSRSWVSKQFSHQYNLHRWSYFVYHHWGCTMYINLWAIVLSLQIPDTVEFVSF